MQELARRLPSTSGVHAALVRTVCFASWLSLLSSSGCTINMMLRTAMIRCPAGTHALVMLMPTCEHAQHSMQAHVEHCCELGQPKLAAPRIQVSGMPMPSASIHPR